MYIETAPSPGVNLVIEPVGNQKFRASLTSKDGNCSWTLKARDIWEAFEIAESETTWIQFED